MKFLVAVLALAAVAHADVSHLPNKDAGAVVLSQNAEVEPDQFKYNYDTSNGISAQESGKLKSLGPDVVALEVQGSNQYPDPQGNIVQISYIANEKGYQPQGAHLPVAPPTQAVPEYILRSLEYINAHPQKPE